MLRQGVDGAGRAGRLVAHLIHSGTRPIAMIAESVSVSAAREGRSSHEGALRVVGIRLVAFDDIEHVTGRWSFLTVMPRAAETFGAIAAQLLVDRIYGRAALNRSSQF